jgi:hypothetical protein
VSALAFCTLEVAFVLILTIAICGFIERGTFSADLRFVAKSLALFLATVLAVWPAAILRLSFVKAYAVMAYLALMRESPWGHAGFIETWRARIFRVTVEWSLIVIAVAVGLPKVRAGRPALLPDWLVRRADAGGDASGLYQHAALFAGVYAGAGSARWPHAAPLPSGLCGGQPALPS